MNRTLLWQLFLLLSLTWTGSGLYASDEVGVEIRYSCLGEDQTFRVFVTRSYDCNSAAPVIDPQLDVVSPSGCQSPLAAGGWILSNLIETTPLCPTLPTHCNSGISPVANGVKEYIHYRDYNFAGATPGCNDYEFRLVTCCRSDSISSGSDGERTFISNGHFDPFLCNQAPHFLFPAVVYLDDSTAARVAFGANDPDGDSLAYALVPCQDTLGIPVTYSSGYSATQPLGPNWSTDLDPRTGNLHFRPNPGGREVAPICLEVREYRKGLLIGTYQRDVLLEVLNTLSNPASANQPQLTTPSVTNVIQGGTWVDSFTVRAALGRPLNFELQVTDADGDTAWVQWTHNLPGAEFYDRTDPVVRRDTFTNIDPVPTLNWIPATGGSYSFGMQIWEKKWCGPRRIGDHGISLQVQDTCLLARFDVDTLFICPGDSARLSPQITGDGPAPYQFSWSTSDTTDSITVVLPGIYWVQVFDHDTVCVSTDTLVVAFAPFCVWPGDANNDGIADNLDILAIGLGYGAKGPARPGATLSWTGQQTSSWGDTIPGGIDLAFVDTDGSDSIQMADTLAISLNYGLNHPLKNGGGRGGPGDPLLFFGAPLGPAGPGDTLRLSIFLGTDSIPADSVYAIAFSVTYDNSLVDSGSAHVGIPDTTWMGIQYQDIFSLQKDRFDDGQVDVGISRNDHISRTDHGRIARFDIIMIDDITGKKGIVDTLHLSFTDVVLIRTDGREIPVNIGSLAIPVSDGVNTGLPGLLDPQHLQIYPNPSNGEVYVETDLTEPVEFSIYHSSGKKVWESDRVRQSTVVDLNDQPPGLYLVRMRHAEGVLTRKIQLIP